MRSGFRNMLECSIEPSEELPVAPEIVEIEDATHDMQTESVQNVVSAK